MANAMQEYADDYGYQLAFLKSDAELYGIFKKAVSKKWDATRFVAAVKASKWYKKHGEAYRQNLALKTTDPATYRQRLASQRAIIADMAHQMGSPVPGAAMAKLTEQSILFGWNDQQIRDQVARYTRVNFQKGAAGDIIQKLKETAYRNGVKLTDTYLNNVLRQVSLGNQTIENAQQAIRDTYGKSVAPGFQKELAQGTDLYDVASPYMQTMASTLELDPSDVDLFDPTIRKALGTSGGTDGKPGSMPMWEFEQSLRQDSRYMKTKQAQDQTMAVGHQVLKDMGVLGG